MDFVAGDADNAGESEKPFDEAVATKEAKKLKVAELRSALEAAGADTKGLKPALVERLVATQRDAVAAAPAAAPAAPAAAPAAPVAAPDAPAAAPSAETAGGQTELELMAAMGLPTAMGPAVTAAPAPAPDDGAQKTCKHCGQLLPASSYVAKQRLKARPTCIECAARLSAQPPPKRPPRTDFSTSPDGVRKQLDYYFSPKNWGQDAFLKSLADDEGSVALVAFLTFPRITALLPTTLDAMKTEEDDLRVLAAAARASPALDLTADGLRVKARRKRERVEKPAAIAGLELSADELARRAKRAAKFGAEATRPPPPVPKRTFAHAGGQMTTNKQVATAKFLRRKQEAEPSQRPAVYDEEE